MICLLCGNNVLVVLSFLFLLFGLIVLVPISISLANVLQVTITKRSHNEIILLDSSCGFKIPTCYRACVKLIRTRWNAHQNYQAQVRCMSSSEIVTHTAHTWVFLKIRGVPKPLVSHSKVNHFG